MSIYRQFASSCVAVAITLCGAQSHAHSTFPTLIQAELSMPCLPACTICHKDNLGGFGTVTEPFGKSMQAAGLIFIDRTVSPALKKLEADATDSDGDGAPDIIELRAGEDPNGTLDLCSQAALSARYGCGAHIAPSPGQDSGACLAALLTALVLGSSLQRTAKRKRARAVVKRARTHSVTLPL